MPQIEPRLAPRLGLRVGEQQAFTILPLGPFCEASHWLVDPRSGRRERVACLSPQPCPACMSGVPSENQWLVPILRPGQVEVESWVSPMPPQPDAGSFSEQVAGLLGRPDVHVLLIVLRRETKWQWVLAARPFPADCAPDEAIVDEFLTSYEEGRVRLQGANWYTEQAILERFPALRAQYMAMRPTAAPAAPDPTALWQAAGLDPRRAGS